MSKKYYQGKYNVKNKSKYYGNYNNIIFRSSWELKVMIWMDNNKDVIRWNSEEIIIPYISPFDGKVHRYFTDFYAEIIINGILKKYIYEVKPSIEKIMPKKPKRVTKSYVQKLKTYIINQEKWKSAYKYCEDRNMTFSILTEKELKIK